MDNNEREELTFAELLATVTLNEEVIITIPEEEVERVKTGIKNIKAKQAAKMKEEGILPPQDTLSFSTTERNEEGDVDLKIILNKKSTIAVKKIVIPDGEF